MHSGIQTTAAAGGSGQLFIYNLSTGTVAAIASTTTGAGNSAASISADGHYVVYQSDASDGHSEIFLYDLTTGHVVFQTANASGASYNPVISPDGHFIIFASDAQLTPDDTNSVADTYVVDVTDPSHPAFKLVSVLADGTQGNAASNLGASISAGGLYIAFGSNASDFSSSGTGGTGNIFVVDPTSGHSAVIQESASSPTVLTASGVIELTGDSSGVTLTVSDQSGKFSAAFDSNGNIQWHFTEAKSDFGSLQPGQLSNQNFVITLSTDDGTTTIPVRVSVFDADLPTITVADVAPVASPVSLAQGKENAPYIITSTVLLAGVADIDGPSLSITSVTIKSGGGTLADNLDGTWTYTPPTGFAGAVTLNYTASDGTLSASSTASLEIISVEVSSITAPTGDDGPGTVVPLTVNFSDAVTVDTSGGTPTLTLSNGATASYVSGSGTNALVFNYTVGATGSGQDAADLATATTNALTLNGGTIKDAAGNAAVLTGANNINPAGTLQIDTAAAAPSAPDLTAATDTGASSTDNITNVTMPGFSGSGAEAGATVTLYDTNGTTVLGSAIADGLGNWSITSTPLTGGSHTLTAKQTDLAGNTSVASAGLAVTIDTAAPAVAITTAGGSTNQAAQIITGTVGLADIGTTVTLFDNGSATPLGTAIVQGDGSWSTSVTLSGNGTHSIVAKDTDAAGNAGTSSAVIYTLSTVGPTVTESLTSDTGSSASDKITSNDALTGSSDANTVVTLKEGATVLGTTTANGAGVWSFTPTGLSDGSHTIVASQTDTFGNTGTAALSFTLDTAAAAPSAPDLTAATDTGASSTDNITNVTTPGFSGSGAEAGATVTLYDTNGTTVLGSAIADGLGNWSITSTPLTGGSHTLTAKQTDLAGNTSVASAGLAVTIDTAAVAPSAPDLTAATDTGASSTDNITNVTTPVFSGSGAEAGATVTLYDTNGTTVLGSAIADGLGNWSITSTPLTGGSHTLTAKQTDLAGNTSVASAGLAVTIDTAAPAVAITTAGGSTNQAAQIITGTVGLADIGTTVTLFDNGSATPLGTAIVQGDGSWSTSVTLSGNGTHSIVAKDTDAAGNAGTSSAVIYTLSTVGPTVTESLTSDTGSSASDKITSNDALTGSSDANAVVTLKEGAAVLGTTTANGAGVWSFTPTGLSDGSHTIVASQTDTFGNTGTAALSFTLDTAAAAPSAPDLTAATDTGASSTDNITNVTTPGFTGSGAEAGATVTLYDTNGTTVLGSAIADGLGNWSITSTPLTGGSHTLTAKQTDLAGNTSVASAGLAVTIDTAAVAPSAPDLTAATDTGASSTDNITNVTTPGFSGSGAEAGATVTLYDTNGTTVLGSAIADGLGNWSITSTPLTGGSHTLTAKQTDLAGNTSVASAGLAVTIDTAAVAPSAPDLTAATDTGARAPTTSPM